MDIVTLQDPIANSKPKRFDNAKTPVVYFGAVTSTANSTPRIKIGETEDHAKRFNQHGASRFGDRVNFTPVCMVRGTRNEERAVLAYFAKHLIEGERETFHDNKELVNYIRWLRDQYYVWVPDSTPPCPGIDKLEIIHGDHWLPNEDRCKSRPNGDMFSHNSIASLPPRAVSVDDFYTNPIIIEAVRESLGGIDLDPASHAFANSVVKAAAFFSIRDDGLSQDWHGKVWLNPPFSQWQYWVPKIISEWKSGRVESMCVLSATRTLTAQYFSDIHESCTAMCVLRGRIPFWGERASTPDDGHAVFYFGQHFVRFASVFGKLGKVYIA